MASALPLCVPRRGTHAGGNPQAWGLPSPHAALSLASRAELLSVFTPPWTGPHRCSPLELDIARNGVLREPSYGGRGWAGKSKMPPAFPSHSRERSAHLEPTWPMACGRWWEGRGVECHACEVSLVCVLASARVLRLSCPVVYGRKPRRRERERSDARFAIH